MTLEQLFEQGAHAGSVCKDAAEFQLAKDAALKAYYDSLNEFVAKQLEPCTNCGCVDWVAPSESGISCIGCGKLISE